MFRTKSGHNGVQRSIPLLTIKESIPYVGSSTGIPHCMLTKVSSIHILEAGGGDNLSSF